MELAIWGKSFPSGGNSYCRGPEMRSCLVHSRHSRSSEYKRVNKGESSKR